VEETKNFGLMEMISFLFINNIKSAFLGMILGVILGIFPVVHAVVNGYVLGFVARKAVEADGILTLWRIFPHGIFELPAIFISLGLGLKISSFILQRRKLKSLRLYFLESLRAFLIIVLPLLAIAAIIEGSLIVLMR
jgi:stage II sporulation protein M